MSLAVIAAVGIAAVTALRGRGGMKGSTSDKGAASAPTPADTSIIAADSAPPVVPPPATNVTARGAVDAPTSTMSVASAAVVPPATPPATTGAAMTGTARSVALLVPIGRTSLRDTMVAERAGDTVRVSFDLMLSRTRRPDKFEAIVRSTLPQIYGAAADSALRALPQGAVARAGDLIATLPERGFHIPVAGGRTIAVWPETRAGRDGPLVVAYRAVASR